MLKEFKSFFRPTLFSLNELIHPVYEGTHHQKTNLTAMSESIYDYKIKTDLELSRNHRRYDRSLQLLMKFDETWNIFLNSPSMVFLKTEIDDKIMERNRLVRAMHLYQVRIAQQVSRSFSTSTDIEAMSYRLAAAAEGTQLLTQILATRDKKIEKQIASFS
ncbi:hypothetical protein BDB01DRAFT_837196 [Pilobolus umbonatus]|nr:hypothetical protein BDB01DRAFT_837196 [Pilobolus umbonatus]